MTKEEAIKIFLKEKKQAYNSLVFKPADGFFFVEGIDTYLTIRDLSNNLYLIMFGSGAYKINKKTGKIEIFDIYVASSSCTL